MPLKPFLWTNPPRTHPTFFLAVWQIFVIMVGPLSSGISITWWGEWEVISSPKRPTTKVTSSPKSRKSPEKLSTCGEAGPLGGWWSLLGVVSQQLVAELWLANTSEFISLHIKFSYGGLIYIYKKSTKINFWFVKFLISSNHKQSNFHYCIFRKEFTVFFLHFSLFSALEVLSTFFCTNRAKRSVLANKAEPMQIWWAQQKRKRGQSCLNGYVTYQAVEPRVIVRLFVVEIMYYKNRRKTLSHSR